MDYSEKLSIIAKLKKLDENIVLKELIDKEWEKLSALFRGNNVEQKIDGNNSLRDKLVGGSPNIRRDVMPVEHIFPETYIGGHMNDRRVMPQQKPYNEQQFPHDLPGYGESMPYGVPAPVQYAQEPQSVLDRIKQVVGIE